MWALFAFASINICMLESLDKIKNTIKDFQSAKQFDDWLMAVGKSSGDNLRSICVEENHVRGCTTNVWIKGNKIKEKWYFGFYSNTMFTNGVVSIVCEGCNGLTANQVAQIKYTDFDWLGGNLTLNKKKGLQAMLNHIKNIAKT